MLTIDTDRFTRDDVLLSYSRTVQTINKEISGRFDAVLRDAVTQNPLQERDTLLADTAQQYLRSRDVFRRYDPVLRNGEAVCV